MMAARRGSMTGETTMALMRIECPQADAAVIAETADATLLSRPLRSLADIEAIESVPLAERLRIDNFCHRVALAIEARDPQDTAIHYVPDGAMNSGTDLTENDGLITSTKAVRPIPATGAMSRMKLKFSFSYSVPLIALLAPTSSKV